MGGEIHLDGTAVTVVLGDDETTARLALVRAIEVGGGTLVGEAPTGRSLVQLVRNLQPSLVAVDQVIAGSLGGQLVPLLLGAAPACVVAVFEPLVVLRSLDLTRMRLIDKRDPRQLRELVRELAGLPAQAEASNGTPPPPT